jgi:transposase InsO family protein
LRFQFIKAKRARYPVSLLCECLEVSESGFYAWLKRPESTRSKEDRRLETHVRAVFEGSDKTYGSHRIKGELKDDGITVGRHRVRKIMRRADLNVLRAKRFKKTTIADPSRQAAPNLVGRRFDEVATKPNRLWVTDITYIRTWEGWSYLCVFLDVFSRKVIGWKMAETMETSLVTDALSMALTRRGSVKGTIVHSDRGVQFTSDAYGDALKRNGMLVSMSRKGDCWDNAVAESFFATLKGELVDRRAWSTRRAAAAAVGDWIERRYNDVRKHSSLGYVSPTRYEILTRGEQVA